MKMNDKNLTPLQKDILERINKGMRTKEIKKELNCSESSIKSVRANKKLKEAYEESHSESDSNYNAIKEIIPQMLEDIKLIINHPSASTSERLAASKQFIELCKISENLFPKPIPEHVIKIEYV